MRKVMFQVLIMLVTVTILGTGLGVTEGIAAEKAAPIVVGAPIPRASNYGQNGERGMILATEEINAAGGVKVGGVMRPFKLEIIDSRDEEPGVPTSEVLLAIEKLILQTKVDLVAGGPCMSECGMAALDLFARYKKLDVVSIGCYTPGWDEKVSKDKEKFKHSFRESGSVKWYVKEALDLLRQMKEKFGFDKIYVSIDDSAMCRRASEIVENLAAKDGWKIVGKDKHPIGSTDYSGGFDGMQEFGSTNSFRLGVCAGNLHPYEAVGLDGSARVAHRIHRCGRGSRILESHGR